MACFGQGITLLPGQLNADHKLFFHVLASGVVFDRVESPKRIAPRPFLHSLLSGGL